MFRVVETALRYTKLADLDFTRCQDLSAKEFTNLSSRNCAFFKTIFTVANGNTFKRLDLDEADALQLPNVIYMHANRNSRNLMLV